MSFINTCLLLAGTGETIYRRLKIPSGFRSHHPHSVSFIINGGLTLVTVLGSGNTTVKAIEWIPGLTQEVVDVKQVTKTDDTFQQEALLARKSQSAMRT